MSQRELIREALDVWAPGWPRRVGRHQQWAHTQDQALDQLVSADSASEDGYISTYAFPRGHTKDGAIPDIDTLFIDFDIEDGAYERGSGDRDAWRRDLSFLLVRVRRIARFLLDRDAVGWRAALSGHKGVHLFLDFPTVPPNTGTFEEFVAGVNEYARELTGHLMQETDISDLADYVDVTSADLGRLHRVPNTRHPGASESFGEDRYCVAVTLEELAEITPERYEELTRRPRELPMSSREPNEDAGMTIRQHVATANPNAYSRHHSQPSYADYERYRQYVDEVQNDAIELEDVELLTKDRPCVWEFHEREDKFDYGNESHYMETFCIRELQEKHVPVNVMKEFLSNAPDYNEDYTEQRIKEVISRDYQRFNVARILENAPEFANPDTCKVCRRASKELNI